ncbi:MAG: magnesium/cobalt transporter CorA [Flavobacteriaceae bacterium]
MARKRKKTGLAPGTIVFTGDKKVDNIQVHYLNYNEHNLEEQVYESHETIAFKKPSDTVVDWYDVRGMHDTNLIEHIGKSCTIHPLVQEAIADVNQRPKFEEYDNGNFIALRALRFDKETTKLESEQITLYFRKGLVLTFQEQETDLFSDVRKRIKGGRRKIRSCGADYLTYALIDVVVDHYYIVLDDIESVIERLEDDLISGNQDLKNKTKIHELKKELVQVRKSVAPLREAINRFAKSESNLIEDDTYAFLRDLYDHTIQVMDMIESYRDMLNGLQDLFITEVSFKMNKVMQLLTIVSTIFIPLTFLAGIYGMNFTNMPELHWKYGYFILMGTMLFLAIMLILFFRRKKWL